MATLSGKDGKIVIGGSAVAEITSWTFTRTDSSPSYASSSTGGEKTRREGVKDGTGSCEYKWDSTNKQHADMGEGSAVTLLLHIDGQSILTVPALIGSLSYNVDINDGDVVGGTIEFGQTAAVTHPTIPADSP